MHILLVLATVLGPNPQKGAEAAPAVEILDMDGPIDGGRHAPSKQPVEIVDDEPAAAIRDVHPAPRASSEANPIVNADRPSVERGPVLGPDPDFELRPLARPLGIVGVILEPVREANLLLPEGLDPFTRAPREEPIPTEEEERRNKEILERLKRQRELLGTSSIFPHASATVMDEGWRFQAQAGGSFRAGNNSAGNVNSQLRAERHSLFSDFLARLQAFYTQVEQGDANRRVFGEMNFDRSLRGHWICYVRQELEYDEARLIDLRTVTSGGIGFRFIDAVYERLIARTGPTASYIDYGNTDDADAEFISGWLIEGEYRRVLGESSRLEMTSTLFPDFDSEQQFRVRTEGAVLFPIARASAWNWKVGIRHEYILDPVASTNPNDVEGYFSIVYTR